MSEFFRSEKFPWLVCAAAFFLAGATLPSCNSSKEPTATEKQLAEVKAALERVEAELNTLRQGLPPEAKQKLAELENSLKDRKKWPKDARGAEEMRQRLDKIVQALSPVAAERILPQLVRLNWGIEALWNLRSHVNAAPEQLDQAQAAIEELLQRHPPDTFPRNPEGTRNPIEGNRSSSS
ncbi:MAG: hypothetical protein KatS3mg105_4204 [Gemmatales bacterium]|nr:MAG: hypothetical protein KatS3mg105_4204 [Gemmatales bacterium]